MSEPSFAEMMRNPMWPVATDINNWTPAELDPIINLSVEDAQRTGCTTPNLLDLPATPLADVPFPTNGDHSNLGSLACLPQEIIDIIISEMDLRSHEMFARTCHYARWMLMNDRLYQSLLRWIPNIRDLLGHTGLYYWNSIRNFHNELFQPKCRACPRAGDLLFLATGERICHFCMVAHKCYWYLNLNDAQKAFFLTLDELKEVPAIKYQTQRYASGAWPRLAAPTRTFLFPVKCLLQASIRKFGTQASLVAMAQFNYRIHGPTATAARLNEESIYQSLRLAQLQPMTYLPAVMPVPPPWQDYLGAALTWLPHVTQERHEVKRYFCRGCSYLYLARIDLDHAGLSYMGIDPNFGDLRKKLCLTEQRCVTRCWEEVLAHIPECAGCAMLMMRHYRSPLDRALDDEFGPNI
ncbi:uncharacterized protein N7459_000265 [Penicillium hispanicum]|uniref:uncharacterized protein n=1 Tax=Penicillium hispanicum TaxID=1080232 RepID=UPI00253FEB71|nr:uncharacterized protein N7459_000265 [Penicillium hispanicum]KAJ5594057.1 hypothetical protein N7459_000265 [Penicillium hispanicum]